jgi:two-component system, OmpR family, sensor kinase
VREAITARDDFLSVAAHELRNPLTPIVLCVELLRSAHAAGDLLKVTAELGRLDRLVDRFAARTNMLLKIAQITAKKLELQPCQCNLSDTVKDIVNDYLPLAERVGSVMDMAIQEGVVGLVDSMAVAEIVENLLSNAVKYGQGKPIEIALNVSDGFVRISVRDYGIGIAAADKDRIFERFERAVSRDVHSGFGIGLWLVRNLAETMGGSITVTGQTGAGSRFMVSLPISSEGKL